MRWGIKVQCAGAFRGRCAGGKSPRGESEFYERFKAVPPTNFYILDSNLVDTNNSRPLFLPMRRSPMPGLHNPWWSLAVSELGMSMCRGLSRRGESRAVFANASQALAVSVSQVLLRRQQVGVNDLESVALAGTAWYRDADRRRRRVGQNSCHLINGFLPGLMSKRKTAKEGEACSCAPAEPLANAHFGPLVYRAGEMHTTLVFDYPSEQDTAGRTEHISYILRLSRGPTLFCRIGSRRGGLRLPAPTPPDMRGPH